MWVFIPRAPPRALASAVLVAAPAVILGALSNLLVVSELSGLAVWPAAGSGLEAWAALVAFRRHVETLVIVLFVLLALGTFTLLRFAPHARVGLNLWASILVAFLALLVLSGWTLGGPDRASARIGVATALWGTAWSLVALHVFLFLRPLRHRFWVWATLGMGVFYAAVTFLVVLLGVWLSVEVVALSGFVLAAMASFVLVMRRDQALLDLDADASASATAAAGSRVLEPAGSLGLVAAYMVLVFALFGAAYQHHFDYQPTAGMLHYVLMGCAFLVGVPVFAWLMRQAHRRTFLLVVPLAAFVPLILQLVQQQHDVMWAVALGEGLMLAAAVFLFQYMAEALGRITRTGAFVCALGAVLLMGLGGSLVAQLSAVQVFTPDLLLSLQFAMFFTAMLVAMALPETTQPVKKEEEIEEYLEVAKRMSQEGR